MHRVALLVVVALAHARERAELTEELADKMVDNLFDQALASSLLPYPDLDETTLGHLASVPRMTLGSFVSRGMQGATDYSASSWSQAAEISSLGRPDQASRMSASNALRRGLTVAQAASEGSLVGKVALVTGASRGIGEAIAEALAKAGATVVGTATSESGAEAINGRFTGDLKGKGMKLDVKSQEDVEALLKMMTDEYGGVDILVNNAGITKDGLMMRMSDEQWDDVISTNLNSVFKMSKSVLRGMMKKRFGRIISISSVVGSMGNGGQANYAAAKAGMDGFSRSLAREVASRGITVNTVAPGFIKSDMTDKLKDEWKDELLKSVPLGRLGTPKEVADAVLFLASPMADYVTGQTLHVNGGMYM